jgi:hypothetical protein
VGEGATSAAAEEEEAGAEKDAEGGWEVCLAISEVVAQDPRAQKDGRGRSTLASDPYSLTFATLRVAFAAYPPDAPGEAGLRGRGRAVVVAAEEDPGDATAPPGAYQHSMFLRRAAEAEMAASTAAASAATAAVAGATGGGASTATAPGLLPSGGPMGRAVAWAHPVREGVVQRLFALRGGGEWRPKAAAAFEAVGY